MTEPIFVPWLRRGLARGITGVDPLSGALATNPEIVASVDVTDDSGRTIVATQPRRLAGPGDVAGLDASIVLRYEPAEGTGDFESNYFPFVELLAPDLPWMLTPAAATSAGALRPWLVLVVVEEREGVSFEPAVGDGAAVLSVDAAIVAEELWDLADSHAWVHVHSSVDADQIATSVEAGDGRVIARLICPRELDAGRTYRGAVVPAFDLGADAGLGQDTTEATQLEPAWNVDAAEPVTLPVYASWTFATNGVAGDFESLCLRLAPDSDGARLGYHDAVLDDGGLLVDAKTPLGMGFEYGGALVDPGSVARKLPGPTRTWFTDGVVPHLNRAAGRSTLKASPSTYRPERDDPVAGPPHYGSHASERYEVPTSGWQRAINIDVTNRSAAGLGAEVVRQGQHDFLTAAWDQVGALREVHSELNQARFGAELATRHAERFRQLDDGALLFATGKTKAFLPSGDTSATTAIKQSSIVPSGVVSATFFRAARGSGSIGRLLANDRDAVSLAARVSATFVEASGTVGTNSNLDAVAKFTGSFVPEGTYTTRTELGEASGFVATPSDKSPLDPTGLAHTRFSDSRRSSAVLDRPTARTARARVTSPVDLIDPSKLDRTDVSLPPIIIGTGSDRDDLTSVAVAIRSGLQPSKSIAAGLDQRLTGLDLDIEAPIPTRVVIGPWFPDGLAERLQRLSVDFLLPGIDEVAMDRVRLLEVNEKFAESFLAGANHEWAREALWHEFPADLGATAFASLFDRPGNPPAPGPETDLATDMHTWRVKETLGSHVGGAGSNTVVLLRAELVRRYPGLIVTLLEPLKGDVPIGADDLLVADHVHEPSFRGDLDRSTIFVGFDQDSDTVLDDGWYVSIEEPSTGPRFGLDFATGSEKATPPARWENLTWGHVAAAGNVGPHIRFSSLAWDGVAHQKKTWAKNSAHQAGITFQRPFRMIFPAQALLGGQS